MFIVMNYCMFHHRLGVHILYAVTVKTWPIFSNGFGPINQRKELRCRQFVMACYVNVAVALTEQDLRLISSKTIVLRKLNMHFDEFLRTLP